ncbi:ribosome-inactivating family protein [Arsenophonus endosymbiont of Aleurodicus floccissimus]|uniref:ribosome-inactivating family protein n=1 Tax=Arsenophonus endosymbiont of Aleurodicus floccissimus TaxID=2152761 RepID=UPI000E6AE80B
MRSLETVDIDQNILNCSIRNLYNYGSGSTMIGQVADAMLRLIVFTSEATRFSSISAVLNSGTTFRLGARWSI